MAKKWRMNSKWNQNNKGGQYRNDKWKQWWKCKL